MNLRQTIRIAWRDRVEHSARLDRLKNWFLRIYYCHHNARVIEDFEHRMSLVLCECTRGMSKPYYDVDAMLPEIRDFMQEQWDDGYAEGQRDLRDELGLSKP